MRKLLNTVYVSNENAYLKLDGENLVCQVEGEEKLRIPFDNVENIVCFSYIGCSPALMGKCVSKAIPINFISPYGKFWAKVCGETKGNVFLRVSQIECFEKHRLELTKNTVAAKLANSIQVIKRTLHDNVELREDDDIKSVIDNLKAAIEKIYASESVDTVLGIEGNCAKEYFSIFDSMLTNKSSGLSFVERTKHPPLDPVSAVLSFVYTLLTSEVAAALETVGLDSYIGYYHTLRSGRVSLACDLVEELRCIAERFVITMINLKEITEKDFDKQITGAVWLNDDGRKKVITKWQEKKRTDIHHPVLKQKIQLGLLPYVQSNLLAKYVRGDTNEYPSYLHKA